MTINNNINIVVSAIDKVKQPLKNISNEFSGLQGVLKKQNENFKKMTGYGVAATTGIGFGIKKLVDQASDLEETTQKFGVVYRDLGNEADKAAKEIAAGYGLSQKASKQYLADLGDMTAGLGLSQKASLEYSTQVTKMGVDLASFANIAGGSEEAIDRLNKGLLGEHENLKALGIIINKDILNAELLRMQAMGETSKHFTEMSGLELEEIKLQARMNIALSQSTNSIGDFERSKASLANQTRILQSNFEDLTTNLGQAFLPIITELTSALTPIIIQFAEWAGENQELVKKIGIAAISITSIITVLGGLGLILGPIITGFKTLILVVKGLGVALRFLALNPIGLVITTIAAGITIGIALVKNWDTIKEKAIQLGQYILELYENNKILFAIFAPMIAIGIELYKNWDTIKIYAIALWETIKIVAQKIYEAWANAGENIKFAMSQLRENLSEVWQNIKDAMFGIVTSIVDTVVEKFNFLRDTITGVFDKITGIYDKAKNLANKAVNLVGLGSDDDGNVDGARAVGGTVMGKKTYLVGENGPELFTPSTTGKITSNGNMGSGGINLSINMGGVTIKNEADENRLIQKMEEKLTRILELQKMGIS